MNSTENQTGANLRPMDYWWLWVLDAGLVGAGILLLLAAQYGSAEFLGKACAMALLPCIPVLVLVGGAGSTVFALTKVIAERRGLKKPMAVTLLVGPAAMIALALALFGSGRSPLHRLNYLCAGHTPASARQVQLTGYSTFLREEWLAVFKVEPKDFQSFVANARLVPADGFEFQQLFAASVLKATQLGSGLPALTNAQCFKRVFKPGEEHERGTIFALFNPATSTAIVLREYRD